MDYSITSSNGQLVMDWDKSQSCLSNIIVAMSINKGAFFQNQQIGNELFRIRKLTNDTVNIAKQYIEDACRPILQAGRASEIDVTVERDLQDTSRLNYKIRARQPDGLIITYTDYKQVV